MSTTLTLLKIRFARAKLVLSSKLDIKLMNEAAMLLFNHIFSMFLEGKYRC
jgi:hypothetical protein